VEGRAITAQNTSKTLSSGRKLTSYSQQAEEKSNGRKKTSDGWDEW